MLRKVVITASLVPRPVPEEVTSLIEVLRAVKHYSTLSEVAIIVGHFVRGTTVCSCDKQFQS